MLLQVDTTPDTASAVSVTWVVPGNQQWTLRSVYCTVTTVDDGAFLRLYTLVITDGTSVVAQVPISDGGTVGTGSITWAPAPASVDQILGQFVALAPLPKVQLNPGYHVNVQIVNASAGDTLATPAVWYDFTNTTT